MILWKSRRGLDRTIRHGWQASLTGTGISPGPILAWATLVGGGIGIAARGVFSIRSGGSSEPGHPDSSPQDWRHLGWHQIERGGFDADDGTLRWSGYDEAEDRVVLEQPGRLPQAFREQVAASILLEEFVSLDPAAERGPGVVISGRRDLGRRDTPIAWHASPARGTTWDTPGIRELADRATARLRAEYDPTG